MCVICKQAETQMGTTTVTLERGDATIVIKGVPARICPNCGEEYVEEYVEEATAAHLLTVAEEAIRSGVQVDIRRYVAA